MYEIEQIRIVIEYSVHDYNREWNVCSFDSVPLVFVTKVSACQPLIDSKCRSVKLRSRYTRW